MQTSIRMAQNLKNIKALAFDIDGVLTDGSLIPLADGDLLRVFNAKDSMSMRVASLKGLVTAIISGGDTEALRKRCLHCGIKEENLFLGCRGKLPVLKKFCEQNGLKPEDVAYMGDDIPDVPVIRECGLGIAPADAAEEARAAADYVCSRPGGRGAVREVVEMILKAQGKWVFDDYSKVY